MIRTHNAFHLGDNIVNLHFLRKMVQANPGLEIEHKAHAQYLGALQSLVTDLPQIKLVELTEPPTDSIDTWRGCNGFWYSHPLKLDFCAFHLEHFSFLAMRMGLPSPLLKPEDMLMDAPILDPENFMHDEIDVLLLDCAPQSNQWPQYSEQEFRRLHNALKQKNLRVITASETRAWGWGVAQIGALAGKAHYIIGTANGPFWTCANKWANENATQIIAMNGLGEAINFSPKFVTVPNIMGALDFL